MWSPEALRKPILFWVKNSFASETATSSLRNRDESRDLDWSRVLEESRERELNLELGLQRSTFVKMLLQKSDLGYLQPFSKKI